MVPRIVRWRCGNQRDAVLIPFALQGHHGPAEERSVGQPSFGLWILKKAILLHVKA